MTMNGLQALHNLEERIYRLKKTTEAALFEADQANCKAEAAQAQIDSLFAELRRLRLDLNAVDQR